MKTVAIIGIGRVGGALALALDRCGYDVSKLFVRAGNENGVAVLAARVGAEVLSAEIITQVDVDLLFITTGDSDIKSVVSKLPRAKSGSIVLHTSGALASSELFAAKEEGYSVGSMHPLLSIADPLIGSEQFAGAYFCLEGDEDAKMGAAQVVEKLGGESFVIPTEMKALYHASAVMACGHMIALEDTAIELMQRCGLEGERAKTILMPLIKSTVENLNRKTASKALTGPFARGDAHTIAGHLRAIEKYCDEEDDAIYRLLALRSLKLARENGLSNTKSETINRLLNRV